VDDAGDLVASADVKQRIKVGDVRLFGKHPPATLTGQVLREDRRPALDQHA
jgi:hypothetical protein